MRVVELSADLESAWTTFVDQHPHGLVYYGLRYRDFIRDITGARQHYCVALDDDKLVGVMPLMSLDGPYGRVLNALPFFGGYGMPLATTNDAFEALLVAWNSMTMQDDTAAATMIGNPLMRDVDGGIDYDALDYRSGQFTSLAFIGDPELEILDLIEGAGRRNINSARKAGVTVSEDANALGFLEQFHRENMTAIGGTAKPPRYFSAIAEYFRYGLDWRLYVAKQHGEIIAATLLFYANGVVEYFTPAISEKGRELQATSLILLQAMTDAARAGYKSWNWGGTWTSQEGVYRFKKKWGAEEHKYRYFVTVRNKKLLDASATELLNAYPWFYVLPFNMLSDK